jgi:hypothetical protein
MGIMKTILIVTLIINWVACDGDNENKTIDSNSVSLDINQTEINVNETNHTEIHTNETIQKDSNFTNDLNNTETNNTQINNVHDETNNTINNTESNITEVHNNETIADKNSTEINNNETIADRNNTEINNNETIIDNTNNTEINNNETIVNVTNNTKINYTESNTTTNEQQQINNSNDTTSQQPSQPNNPNTIDTDNLTKERLNPEDTLINASIQPEQTQNEQLTPSDNKPFNLTYEMEKAFKEHHPSETTPQPESKPKPHSNPSTVSIDDLSELNTEKITHEKIEAEERKEREEWEEQISHFSFSNLITLPIKAHDGELLFEEITSPSKIRFAFMVNHPTQKIDFTFTGPSPKGKKQMIKTVKDKNYFFYEHQADIPGTYLFFINNHAHNDAVKVTFAMHADKKEEDSIKTENFDEISAMIEYIDNKMNEVRLKGNIVVKKIEGHNKTSMKHNKSMVIMTVVEVIIMLFIFVIQSIYLKRLLNKF